MSEQATPERSRPAAASSTHGGAEARSGGKNPPSEPPHAWQVGEVLADRYRLLERLGEGAMGAVWAGEHVHMRKKFALKILHPEAVGSSELVARFEREAVAAGNINHPGVAAATDFGQLPDGSFFLVLEYVAGKDLRHLVQEGPVPIARALDLTRQILQALGAAHAKGVVHRDMKPENVMLLARDEREPSMSSPVAARRDVVKILDFGIAKMDANSFGGGEGQALTRMGSIYGTPNYMAPEQALGTNVDARADLYAVGILLYEMISGAPPFDGDPISVIAKHVNDAPPPLRAPQGDALLTTEVRALVDGLLAKDREARPADAQAAIALLDSALASLPDDRQPTVLGDTLAVGPKPPWARETRPLDRVRDLLDPWAKKLGVRVDHLMFALAGAAALVFLLLVWIIARPSSSTSVEVDEPARKKAGVTESVPAFPPAATPTQTPTVTAPPATATASTSAKPSGGNAPIKKSGGGNGLVNKIKSVFK